MISTLKVESKIRYKEVGKGDTIVLLHGYLESLKIWNGIAKELKKNYRVIAIDLPGQGHSSISRDIQTMETMAYEVKLVLEHLKVRKCFMIGHSMGGYVTMAFLANYPSMLSGISLFHSTPYADTEEKKTIRDRTIELLKNGKKNQLYSTHFNKIFADDNVEKMQHRIERLKERVEKTPTEYIISVLEGMKLRLDHSELLANTDKAVLYIIGKKDNFIPFNILDNLKLPEKHEILTLENSGHMGMYEEKEKSIEAISKFIVDYKIFN